MITLEHDALVVTFPEVHPAAVLHIDFQRTLRIPDTAHAYALPPGLGRFPLRHVEDYAPTVPADWQTHGGVLLPMYQAEAFWVNFGSPEVDGWAPYPCAVKVATGKINAVSGEAWRDGLHRRPQDYLVTPEQPWLDGYCIGEGTIRQFVAMPLGAGYTAEEQCTGAAAHGGLQLQVVPMKREAYARRFGKRRSAMTEVMFCCRPAALEMGLAPGGKMRQEVYADPYALGDWDLTRSRRCFVHIANAVTWQAITGEQPPTRPPTAQAYTAAGLPWFDYYAADQVALAGAAPLAGLASVGPLAAAKGQPLPDNTHVTPKVVVPLGSPGKPRVVREGAF